MRKEKKYHYIYKITCTITDRFYVGMHSTDNLEDGYMGSGKKIGYSIRKYGVHAHNKEILEFLPDRASLKRREKDIVNEQFLENPLCMNLQLGGGGGFVSEEHANKFHKAGRLATNKILHERFQNDKEYRERNCTKISNSLKGRQLWLGKKHKEESKKRIGEANSLKQKGICNSQYGTCWITNGLENKKIKSEDTVPDGWTYGRFQKKHVKEN